MSPTPTVLVTGASGYVGSRLRTRLLDRNVRVRSLVRDRSRIAPSPSESALEEIVEGDLLDPASLGAALEGVEVAYYLVHSMGASGDFEDLDRRAAQNFGRAAREAGVERIVYLGGLGSGEALSPHLRSRHETGDVLRESGVPVLELRASIVLGSGSLSFEMIRALVERLPVMITPRWVEVQAQPIGVDDLMDYLVESLDVDFGGGRVVEIGGAEAVSYGDLMREYAAQRGLRRRMIQVPVLTPRLSSLWLALVTPLQAQVGRKLVESIRHATVVEDPVPAAELFSVRPAGIAHAIRAALVREDLGPVDAELPATAAPARPPMAGVRVGNRMVDSRSIHVNAGLRDTFLPVRRIGGETGWYGHDWLWRLRGFLDVLVGGSGMCSPRRDPDQVRTGDVIDCWRVEAFEPDRMLLLRATMRLPGRAWLKFEVDEESGGSRLSQTAVFDPKGLAGLFYWHLVCPLHALVFSRMLAGIAEAAESTDRRDEAVPVRGSWARES